MLYDMKADAFKVLNCIDQEDRSREMARQRVIREALAGRQGRYTNPIPGLLDSVRKLATRKPGITPKPMSQDPDGVGTHS